MYIATCKYVYTCTYMCIAMYIHTTQYMYSSYSYMLMYDLLFVTNRPLKRLIVDTDSHLLLVVPEPCTE